MGKLSRRSVRALILLLIISGMITFGMNYNPEVPSRWVYPVPKTPAINYLLNDTGMFRIIALGPSTLPANTASYFGLDDVRLYDGLTPVYYGGLLRLATNWQGYESTITIISNFNLLRLMNVKYILTSPDNALGVDDVIANSQMKHFAREGLVKLVYHGMDGNIFLVNDFIQRAFVVHRVNITNDDEAAKVISSHSFDPTTIAIISRTSSVASSAMKTGDGGDASIIKYGAQFVSVEVTTKSDGYLILSDTYFEGWQAVIDGLAVPILRADLCFRAVFVGIGTHVVTFTYAPESFRVGVQISMTSLFLMIGMLVLDAVRKKNGSRARF